jgi:hypothetical protein
VPFGQLVRDKANRPGYHMILFKRVIFISSKSLLKFFSESFSEFFSESLSEFFSKLFSEFFELISYLHKCRKKTEYIVDRCHEENLVKTTMKSIRWLDQHCVIAEKNNTLLSSTLRVRWKRFWEMIFFFMILIIDLEKRVDVKCLLVFWRVFQWRVSNEIS